MRSRFRYRWSLISLAIISIASCGPGQSSAKTGPQTLVVDNSFVYDDLDPVQGALETSIIVDKSVYDTLTTVNPHDLSKPYPSLATSWTVSSDAKTTTFRLRQGVKFASGNPFTSTDVVWSLTRLNVVGQQSGLNLPMVGLKVDAPDPYTVVFTSDTPNPAVPFAMTISNAGILDSVLVQLHGGTDDAKDKADTFLNTSSAGSGPYMVQSVDRTSQIILKANPNYWGTKPVYSTVILRNAPPPTQAFDVQDGQAQLALDISPAAAASLRSSVHVIAAPSSDQIYLALNANSSILKLGQDQNFRDALKYGLDYKGLVALAGKGAAQATGFIPDGFLGSLPLSDAPQRDVVRARAALAKVGVANPIVQLNYASDRVIDGLSLTPFAIKIQSDLKEIGITVNVVGQPKAVEVQTVQAGKEQIQLGTNTADYPDAADFTGAYTVGGTDTGYMGWVPGMDPTIDGLTTAANSATQPTDRGPAYEDLEKAMNAKSYWEFLLQPGRVLVAANSVQNAAVNPFTWVDFGSLT